MATNGSDEVVIPPGDEAECSETTVEIKIKTLDSRTYTLRVNKRVSVPELKEQIQTITGVLSEQQRLICRGRVLKDDQLLSAYHVEDGHTLHLVVRQPISASSTSTTGSMGSDSLPNQQASDPASTDGQNRGNPVAHSVLLGAFNMPNQGEGGVPDLNRILSAVFTSIGIPNVGNNSEGTVNPREAGLNRLEAGVASGVSDSTQHQAETRTRATYDPLQEALRFPTAVSSGSFQPPVIPDSVTTLFRYLTLLRHEFNLNGGGRTVDPGILSSDDQNNSAALGPGGGQGGLPTPASLAEVMLSTRQMLIEQAGECLSQLARRLEGQANVTTPSRRNGIQIIAMRSGALLQNLGTFLLELGRATMTLRMGRSPSDAVLNAGPAVFISPTGPNPIMVQPCPAQLGMGPMGIGANMGLLNPGPSPMGGSLGSAFMPRNIDIRIRRGPLLSTSNADQNEQSGIQQTTGQTGPERGSSNANLAHRVAAGASGAQSYAREADVRRQPVRTVVAAVPAQASRPASNSSGNSVGVYYHLLPRGQQVTTGQMSDASGSPSSGLRDSDVPESGRRLTPDSAMQQQNIESDTETPVTGVGAETAYLFPEIAPSTVPLVRLSSSVIEHHQQGLPAANSTGLEPSDANNNYSSFGFGAQSSAESEQLPTATSPGQHIHVDYIDFLGAESTTLSQGVNASETVRQEEEPRVGVDGAFLSRLLSDIMPYLSGITGLEPSVSAQERGDVSEERVTPETRESEENPSDIGTARRSSDPPSSPRDSKRPKNE
ncbi:hypothetical protein Syun_025510 [Stephania yunnanensis]|uniref:Ubiquitin-like domain-containing protein n=1 Tax=Stephania yunnanensis TaxID=152371 RepID=A0AAP0EUE5_9MAGN